MSSVIAIGHISTTALAAVTLGFMTANVSGLSIILGMTNTLDTILPSAWTSDQPQLVGLWTQRMGTYNVINRVTMLTSNVSYSPIYNINCECLRSV